MYSRKINGLLRLWQLLCLANFITWCESLSLLYLQTWIMLKIYLLVWNVIDLSGMMIVKNRIQFDDHPCLFFCKIIVEILNMGWRWCKLYSIYRLTKIAELGITIHTEFEFSKSFVTDSSPVKIGFCISSLKGCVTVFKWTMIWYKPFNIVWKTQKTC